MQVEATLELEWQEAQMHLDTAWAEWVKERAVWRGVQEAVIRRLEELEALSTVHKS